MRIQKVRVEGFRLLHDIELLLEPTSTVIVGRNNSGKTSLIDVFDRFTGEIRGHFQLEDFSAEMRVKFFQAKELSNNGASAEAVLSALPKITLTLTFEYDSTAPDLGPLAPFIIDLDVDTTTAIARVEYAASLSTQAVLFDLPPSLKELQGNDPQYLRWLKGVIPRAYSIRVVAVDPTDSTNERHFSSASVFDALLQCDFVHAQRTLDKGRSADCDVIGKLLSVLFKTVTAPTSAADDQALAAKLRASVDDVERSIQHDFDSMLKELLPALDVLGFPSLNDTELRPETSLDVEALLSDHTKIVYTGIDGVHLPEGYNGLGTRNLIYMLLQLETYHKAYRNSVTRPSSHIIFIEEPEAHLHPQMQEVFIHQLNAAIGKLSARYSQEPIWKVQFVITTHSSHVANAAPFEAMRYFLNAPSSTTGARRTKVKDFKKGMATISSEDRDFLHQYMTLTKCDLYFADKAIFVEGTTERLLMPRLCELVDRTLDEEHKLAKQYVSSVEVGGAYAHLFYPLVDFLELKSLIITDLDSVRPVKKTTRNGKEMVKWEKCPQASGERTCNAAIREWFRPKDDDAVGEWQVTLVQLASKDETEKQRGYRRIAYQVPENPASGSCARSFEDALVLANPDRFDWPRESDEATEAWDIARDLPKAETALRFALREKDWIVPRYISEGLRWLAHPAPPPEETPPLEAGDHLEPKGCST